jgi:ureidoglycolate hydrolase
MKKMKAVQVSQENFRDFGQMIAVPASGTLEPSAQSEIQTFFGKLGLIQCEGAVEIGICIARKRPFEITQIEQHAKTSELLFAMVGDFITPVAPSIIKNGIALPDMEKAIAIRVNQGQGVVFNKGIWHWTPYPVDDTATVLVAFQENTPQDDFIAAELAEAITVVLN